MTLYRFRYERGDGHYSPAPATRHASIKEARARAAELFKRRGWEAYYFWEIAPGVSIYEGTRKKGEVYYNGYDGGYMFENGKSARRMDPETGEILGKKSRRRTGSRREFT